MIAATAYRNIFRSIFRRSMCKNVGHDDHASVSTETPNKTLEAHTTVKDEINEANMQDSRVPDPDNSDEVSPLSFRTAFEKFGSDNFLSPIPTEAPKPEESFTTMFRNSKFAELGDAKGQLVFGKIYHTVGDDIYVDFGWKFPCVVQRPVANADLYVRNACVRLRINDLELSTRFLGGTSEFTLNEADCTLLGLVSSPLAKSKSEPSMEV